VSVETEISVVDLLVAEFSPKPIATPASPAVTHMTARRIEVSLPVRIEIEERNLERETGGDV
jgi:hypothetical protein